ncbi:MAG: TolC family protein [Caulobacteraceae bacterium]|nr:TolC family protein [Caulobacteraceae bacterium]
MTGDLKPSNRLRRKKRRAPLFLVAASLLVLSACSTYHPAPLPTRPDLGASVDALRVDISRLELEPLKPVRIDPRQGFTPLAVAVLAVLNNPDLRAKRAALGVSGAEVFAAGLLPDPQLASNVDKPIAGTDKFTGFGLSPSIDLAALLAVADNKRIARFNARQANLDVLWAEWTTAQQARILAETALANEARAGLLDQVMQAAGERASASGEAVTRGDISGPTAAADLAAKLDVQAQLATARAAAAKARRDLNALLGLDASVQLPLVEDAQPLGYDAAEVTRRLSALPTLRPDLLALQAGYEAQDVNLRKAIVAEFPLTQIAFAFARDPTPTTTVGLSAVLALPIFNGNRGQVRVQEATREQLRAEYQARLDQTSADVASDLADLAASKSQADVLNADMPRLESMLGASPAAFARRDIDSQTYLTLLQSVISRETDLQDRQLAVRVAEIQLETALFLPPTDQRAAR